VVQFCFIVSALLKIFNNFLLGTRFVTLFWGKTVSNRTSRAFELASVCDHPNAVWLTKLFAGRDVTSRAEARQVFLGCENDPRALCLLVCLEAAWRMKFVKLPILAKR
jgi:hypothetical protein